MDKIKVIKTEQDYHAALKLVEELMDRHSGVLIWM